MRMRQALLATVLSVLALGGVVATAPVGAATPAPEETGFQGSINYYSLNFDLVGTVTIKNGRYSVSGYIHPPGMSKCEEEGNPYVKVRLTGETADGTRWGKPGWDGYQWRQQWWDVSDSDQICDTIAWAGQMPFTREGDWDPDDRKILLDVCLWYSSWNGWYCDSPNLVIEPRPPA
jgi:hypothetical protein